MWNLQSHTVTTLALFLTATTLAFSQSTSRVSVSSSGVEGNDESGRPSISSDGRFVAFQSLALNLVTPTVNNSRDIYVHDRQTGRTTRVSVGAGGIEGNEDSRNPSISADGRFVAFDSVASNLVPLTINNYRDVYVHDRQTGETTRVSVNLSGVEGNDESWNPSISADGRYVAFESLASNLVASTLNGYRDVYVHDRQTGQTTRASIDSIGVEGNDESGEPSISGDGRFVAFESLASNLVASTINNYRDIYVHDRLTEETTRVSVSSSGIEGDDESRETSISEDGRFVAFQSLANNLVAPTSNNYRDVYVHDRDSGQTNRVSVDSTGIEGNDESSEPSISPCGKFVAFSSLATNLVAINLNNFRDVYVHNLDTGQTTKASLGSGGVEGDDESLTPSISASGRYVAFGSLAGNFVAPTINGYRDIYVRDRGGPTLTKAGTCPGPITLIITNATPGGVVAIVYGPTGTFNNPSPPCQGLILGISSPNLAATNVADPVGVATFGRRLPAKACGLSIQAVDIQMCLATNVVTL